MEFGTPDALRTRGHALAPGPVCPLVWEDGVRAADSLRHHERMGHGAVLVALLPASIRRRRDRATPTPFGCPTGGALDWNVDVEGALRLRYGHLLGEEARRIDLMPLYRTEWGLRLLPDGTTSDRLDWCGPVPFDWSAR